MKRQWITAGVIAVCLAVLGAVWLFLGNPDSSEGNKERKEIALWKDGSTIQQIETENEQGGFLLYWDGEEAAVKGMEDLPLDEGTVENIRKNLENLIAEQEVSDGQDRLSDFGLDHPKAQVLITSDNGDNMTVQIGEEVPGEDGTLRYLLWEDQVLIIKSSQIEDLLYGRESLVSRELTPEYPEGEEDLLVTRLEIAENGGSDLILEYRDSQELAGYTVNSYQMVSPRDYPADAGVTEDVFPDLFGIQAESVERIHPDEQEKETTGLADPWKTLQVEYTDSEGKAYSFSLQVSRPDHGMVYVMSGDTDVIYTCSEDKMPWMEETADSLVSHTVLAADIKTLDRLEITAGGEQYQFQFEDVGGEKERITCNGSETDGGSFRSFYYTLAGLSADQVLFTDFPDTAALKEEARITYQYQDGTEDVLTCYHEDSRQVYVELNQGERGFLLQASQLETMLDTVKRLAAGEEIAARY